MPVTAKLSLRFYEKFGEEIANELVEWFNSVDATYRSELRDLNELNFARFDAKLEQRVAELDARIERGLAEVRAEFRATLSRELGSLRVELIKWSFVFFATAALAVIGLR
jgi:hypothetical protein